MIWGEHIEDNCEMFFYATLDGFSVNYFKIIKSKTSKLIKPQTASDPWSIAKESKIDEQNKIKIHSRCKKIRIRNLQQTKNIRLWLIPELSGRRAEIRNIYIPPKLEDNIRLNNLCSAKKSIDINEKNHNTDTVNRQRKKNL